MGDFIACAILGIAIIGSLVHIHQIYRTFRESE